MSHELSIITKGIAYDLASTSFGRIPVVAEKLGTVDSIEAKPTRWRIARGTFLNPRFSPWVRHGGIEDGGTRPADYPDVAVMTFSKEAVDQSARRYSFAKHAGAYVLDGLVIMVGTSSAVEIFGTDPSDDSRYIMGMRIGEGLFVGQPGLLTSRRNFIPLHDAELESQFMRKAEVNPTIPII